MRAWGALASALLCAASSGCSADKLTQIVVVVESDLSVPGQIDAVSVEATGPGTAPVMASGALSGAGAIPLPRYVTLVHRGGPLGPVDVRAAGLLAGSEVVDREARVFFVQGRTMVLRLALLDACVGVRCRGGDRTCAAEGCRDVMIDPAELAEWTGTIGSDAGTEVGTDGCRPEPESCNGIDDDCDGMTDEDFDLRTHPEHCGACDTACTVGGPMATAACIDGSCGLTCDSGFGDCNAMATDGCETDLYDVASCGDCSTMCADPARYCEVTGTTATCVESCGASLIRCGSTCADPSRNLRHCGRCDNACAPDNARGACISGSCTVASCDRGFGDCNRMPDDGCEASLGTSRNCASCGDACRPGEACVDGMCTDACPASCQCTGHCTADRPCTCDAGCPCTFSCGMDCEVTCDGTGASCDIGAEGGGDVRQITCTDGASCQVVVDATLANDIECSGGGTTCTVECTGSEDCAVDCRRGAECVLRCDTSGACDFDTCDGSERDCGGDVRVCNRSCP